MLTPELEDELRAIIRAELQLAVRAIVDDGLEPLLNVVAEMETKIGGLLVTQSESLGAVVDSQRRIETALASFANPDDADEPWRASLDDVTLDDDQ